MKPITLFFKNQREIMSDIYNLKDNDAKGRLISLGSSLMTSFYNVFITGIFYTGFLSMYDISIEGAGIISYIPLIASCSSLFSSIILEKIKKRKKILVASKIYFYAMYILATTLMPQFITDPTARLWAFGIILFLAYAVYALFSPGFTPWFYTFYPNDNERRTRYITYNQIFSSIMSSAVMLLSAVITDALKGSPAQDTIILVMRYLAFVLVLIDVFMQAQAIEYPYPPSPQIKFRQIFTLPFQYKKFLYCLLMMFAWNFIANLNNGLWAYHLLNHFDFSYTLINSMSVMYTFILIFTQPFWRGVLRKYSWIKTFGLTCLVWMPTEVMFFLMNPTNLYLYVPLCVVQNLLSVGLNLSYSNILYMNLPSENSTAHIAFYSVGCNLFAFLGLFVGTQISSITGDNAIWFLNMEFYSVQFTTLARAITMFALGLLLTLKWRSFTPQKDIDEVEAYASLPKIKRR
ncbi:MAG: MFS transporter [Firmicutes bacterium]|nr:MFS transporter [Bacillota bacterium]